MNFLKDVFTPQTRQWIYNVSAVVLPLLIIFGIVTDNVASQILAIIGAVFNVTMASSNITPKQNLQEIVYTPTDYTPKHAMPDNKIEVK